MRKEEKTVKKAKKSTVWIWRAVFTLATLLVLAFIFSNSAATAEQSSGLSERVTKWVQTIFRAIAPQSWVAGATGEDFARLHGIVRKIAHFTEFFALGACSTWCYLSYCRFAVGLTLPATTVIFVPILDEFLQGSVEGRATELLDLVIDTAGGLTGVLVGLVLAAAVLAGLARRKKRLKGE